MGLDDELAGSSTRWDINQSEQTVRTTIRGVSLARPIRIRSVPAAALLQRANWLIRGSRHVSEAPAFAWFEQGKESGHFRK